MDIVKFGGSIITDKSKECTLKIDNLYRLAREIAASTVPGGAILVHGAGSFGHLKAKAGGVQHGLNGLSPKEKRQRTLAVAEVQADVRLLDLEVLRALAKAGVPATAIPPAAVGEMDNKVLVGMEMSSFYNAMDLKMMPVTFGDVVPDGTLGFSICSGDQAIYKLAVEFQPKRIIFACDVDGIFDADPRTSEGAKLYPHLSIDEARQLSPGGREGDVTGAMGGKLGWGIKMAELGAKVYFINGTVPGRLADILTGKETPCTLLEE